MTSSATQSIIPSAIPQSLGAKPFYAWMASFRTVADVEVTGNLLTDPVIRQMHAILEAGYGEETLARENKDLPARTPRDIMRSIIEAYVHISTQASSGRFASSEPMEFSILTLCAMLYGDYIPVLDGIVDRIEVLPLCNGCRGCECRATACLCKSPTHAAYHGCEECRQCPFCAPRQQWLKILSIFSKRICHIGRSAKASMSGLPHVVIDEYGAITKFATSCVFPLDRDILAALSPFPVQGADLFEIEENGEKRQVSANDADDALAIISAKNAERLLRLPGLRNAAMRDLEPKMYKKASKGRNSGITVEQWRAAFCANN